MAAYARGSRAPAQCLHREGVGPALVEEPRQVHSEPLLGAAVLPYEQGAGQVSLLFRLGHNQGKVIPEATN